MGRSWVMYAVARGMTAIVMVCLGATSGWGLPHTLGASCRAASLARAPATSLGTGLASELLLERLDDERHDRDVRAHAVKLQLTVERWAPSTLSRILKNEKYVGRWTWNRTETRRDPRTGRKRRVSKPNDEWHVVQDEALRIVPQEVWARAQARWVEIDGTWPVARKARGFEKQQRSYVETHPPHLLSGMLRCGTCGAAMGQVSGKAGGYYGCLGGAKHACVNRLLVQRKLVERWVTTALRDRIAEPRLLASVLARVEKNVQQLMTHVPQQIKEKRVAKAAEERRVANFVEFIGDGKGTRALASALTEAERRVDTLREELDLLTSTAATVFQTPPLEWVARRVHSLDETLAKDVTRSALVLREILGPITLRPVAPGEVGRPYYQAETSIQVLNLLQDPDDGSNSLRKWSRRESNPRPLECHAWSGGGAPPSTTVRDYAQNPMRSWVVETVTNGHAPSDPHRTHTASAHHSLTR
jgi:Recombinase/Recombinase zinc beta ribbon domain